MTRRFVTLFSILMAAAVSALVWLSCSIEQPGVGKDNEDTKFQHADFTDKNACTDCHEDDRPSPEHGKGTECGVCHESKDEKGAAFTPKAGITSSGESKTNTDTASSTGSGTGSGTGTDGCDAAKAHEHPAGLTSCTACHEKDRPDPPHPASGDCAACHEPSNTGCPWKPK